MSKSESYSKAEFSERRIVRSSELWFPNYDMDSAHDMIIVKSHLLNFLRAEFVRIFTECCEVSEVFRSFRSVDWTHDMIIVKWHLFIWHERKLCALTNAPPVQSTQTGQLLSTLFHAKLFCRSGLCLAPWAIHIRSKVQATIILAGITIHWAPKKDIWKNFLFIWWWQMLWWKHVLTIKL